MMLKQLFYNCAYSIEYQTAGHDVNYAFVEYDQILYIYFQGSSSTTDWIRNFLFTKKVYKEFRVHRGFLKAYLEVRDIILNKVYDTITYGDEKTTSYKYNKIIVVGYSHGGALCQLALEDLVYHFPEIDIVGYAFESPRCIKAKKSIRDRWNMLYVIETNYDIVCHLPPKICGYDDLGIRINTIGDTDLVEGNMPKCIKSHFPQVVYNGLRRFER